MSAYSCAEVADASAYRCPVVTAADTASCGRSSTIVFHLPQSSHLPTHFGDCDPHSWQTKMVLAKYTRQTDPEVLEQTYRFALEVYVKDPTVSPVSIQPIVQQSAQWNLVDAKLASSTPLSAYYDNSYIEEIKRSGFLSELWR